MPFSVVTARVRFDETGAFRELPLLVCEKGPVASVADYCLTKNKSLSWMEKVTRASKIFCQYVEAQGEAKEDNWKLFRNFATCIRIGTIDPTSGNDPSSLYWQPRTETEVDRIIRVLTDMLDWLSREYETDADTFNPKYEGTSLDRRIEHLAYLHRKSRSFLGHTWHSDAKRDSKMHLTGPRNSRKQNPKQPPRFPDDRFAELLFKGFVVAGKPDYRGMLITLLMHGGGVRESEPFHLYVDDVQPDMEDPSIALVTIHHPQDGIAPRGFTNQFGKQGTRAQYLASYGLVPRNLRRKDAGWKNNAEDSDGYMQVHWFPEEYGRWFMKLWKRYLKTIAAVKRQHPYAFVSLQGPAIGNPYTPQQFRRAFARAVRRIGLVPQKAYGTTEHGCRHAYAWRLKKTGVDKIYIQRFIYHDSPESHVIYTAPERKEIAEALKNAQLKLNEASEFPGVLTIDDWIKV